MRLLLIGEALAKCIYVTFEEQRPQSNGDKVAVAVAVAVSVKAN